MKRLLYILVAVAGAGIVLASCTPAEPTPQEETSTPIYQRIVLPPDE